MLLFFLSSAVLLTSSQYDGDDWNCNAGRGDIISRYGDLGGSLLQNIVGLGTGCDNSYTIRMSGSSTVYPLAKIWAIEYNQCEQTGCADIILSGGGSSVGASDVCNNASDIGDMSRDWKSSEGFKYSQDSGYTVGCVGSNYTTVSQIPVALDGITVFIKRGSSLENCINDLGGLTYGDLRWIYSEYTDSQLAAEGSYVPSGSANDVTMRKWSEIDGDCPDEEIKIYGAGTASGTFDFFSEEIFNGESFSSDRNYNGSEDDDIIVDYILNNNNSIGYVGYSHYLRFTNEITAISISSVTATGGGFGSPYIFPTETSIDVENDAILDFLNFGFSDLGQQLLVNQTGYVALPGSEYDVSYNNTQTRGALNDNYDYGDLGGSVDNVYTTITSGCNSYDTVNVSGSSTVYPVAKVWAYNYIEWSSNNDECLTIYVTDGGSSTGGRRVCNGIVDIGDMSRDWKSSEAEALTDGYTFQCLTPKFSDDCNRVTQIELGVDGITVFVQGGSDLETCISAKGGLTYSEVLSIFESSGSSKTWKDTVSSSCPDDNILLYIPGVKSGTLAFFCEEIMGSDDCSTSDFYSNSVFSEDDDVLTEGVKNNANAMGFAGYAHFTREVSYLYGIPLNDESGSGYVTPSESSIDDESYPLSRPLYMNIRKNREDNMNIQNYLRFGLANTMGQKLLSDVIGYVTLEESVLNDQISRIGGNDGYTDTTDLCDVTPGEYDTPDWSCTGGRGNIVQRYGDLGGSLSQLVVGTGSDCENSWDFSISGSSTVYPLAKIWAIEFNQCMGYGCSNISIAGGGSSQGASDVCDGTSDIGDMSRDWKSTEAFKYSQDDFTVGCVDSNYTSVSQIPVALDGITVFVKSGSDLADCLTITMDGLTYGDLRWIYSEYSDSLLSSDSSYVPSNTENNVNSRKWSEINAACPDVEIEIYGADSASGTYDFFSDEIFGDDSFATNRGYIGSEDDDVIVANVLASDYAIGFVGYSHYLRYTDEVSPISISSDTSTGGGSGSSYVAPSVTTIDDGTYPISRTIYMNIENIAFSQNDAILEFLNFGFSDLGQQLLVNQTGYVALPGSEYDVSYNNTQTRGALNDNYDYGDLGGSVDNVYTTTTTGCGGSYDTVNISGSSTVYPVAKVWSYNYIEWSSNNDECLTIYVTDGGSSTGGRRVCNGIVDIGDMSRDWKSNEARVLNDGYTFQCLTPKFSDDCNRVTQIELGVDGITVFVQSDSTLATCISNLGGLTYSQVESIFSSSSSSKTWNSVLGSSCPNTNILLYVPGINSGTLAFFCEEIFDNDDCTTSDFYSNVVFSEDDDALIDGVRDNVNAIGFAGYAHFVRAVDSLYGIALNNEGGSGYVFPSVRSIDDESYPLSRPLYMNIRKDIEEDSNIKNLLSFGLDSDMGQALLGDVVGYVALNGSVLSNEISKISGNDDYSDTTTVCTTTNDVYDTPDWDCGTGRGNIISRYGDLGGGLSQLVVGTGSGCENSWEFSISGSSTVYPLAKIWAIEFNQCLGYGCSNISIAGGGSSQGASDVCDSTSDIGDMSRDWKSTEAFKYSQDSGFTVGCIGTNYTTVSQIPVALDGITVFVQTGSDLETCIVNTLGGLTYGDLRWIYSEYSDSELSSDSSYVPSGSNNDVSSRKWSEINAACPDVEIRIYGADSASGTFDFFSEEIFGDDTFSDSRGYLGSEDDDVIANWLLNDENGIGYVGYSHYLRFADVLTAIDVSSSTSTGGGSGSSYVTPSETSIDDGTYPISRRIYMNIDNVAFSENDAILEFLNFGFSDLGQQLLVNQTGYVALPTSEYDTSYDNTQTRGALNDNYDYGDLGGSVDNTYTTTTSGCGGSYDTVNISGSSTVYPVAKVWSYNYIEWSSNNEDCLTIYVTDGGSSTGGRRVCNGIVDIGDMSRNWKSSEADMLPDGYTYQCLTPKFKDDCNRVTQIELGVDGITIFVQSGSDLETCISGLGGLTYSQVQSIFQSVSGTRRWRTVLDSSCPNTEILLYVPGINSGTLAFFCEEIFGSDDCSTSDFYSNAVFSEDDDTLIDGVQANSNAIGFAGYAHYTRAVDSLYGIPLHDGSDYITPTVDSIDDESYPLSRPLYMNIRKDVEENTNIQNLLGFGLNSVTGQALLSNVVGYVELDSSTLATQISKIGGNDAYADNSDYCNATSDAFDTPDWDCGTGRGDIVRRYGDLGGSLSQRIVGRGTGCENAMTFSVSGSSTVYPLAKIWAIEFNQCEMNGCANILLSGGGSSQGASDVCDGTSDIGDMSRDWKSTEGFKYTQDDGYTVGCVSGDSYKTVSQIPVALDGITVFVRTGSDVEDCILNTLGGLTYGELRWIYSEYSDTELLSDSSYVPSDSSNNASSRRWSEIDASCPDVEIKIYGADSTSGTFDFFSEEIFGDDTFSDSRGYLGSEDDDVIANWVVNDGNAIGYVGYSHYLRFADVLTAIPISSDASTGSGDGSDYMTPSESSIDDGSYPISRTIYMNIENIAFSQNDAILEFLNFGFTDLGQQLLVNQTGYVALPTSQYGTSYDNVQTRGALNDNYDYGDLGGSVDNTYITTTECGVNSYDMINISGSSTVYPVAKVWAYNYIEFQSNEEQCLKIFVTDGGSSTGARRVCNGIVDIGDMSRNWKSEEASVLGDGYTYQCLTPKFSDDCIRVTQIELGVDGITVFVATGTSLQSCIAGLNGLTYTQVKDIFSSSSGTKTWSGVLGSSCPSSEISLYVPGINSGTLAFFCEEIMGSDDCSTSDFYSNAVFSEDDDVLTDGVRNNANAIGFAGYAHYTRVIDFLYGIPLNDESGSGYITPSESSIDSESYPLSRPLYMNIRKDIEGQSYIQNFLQFGLNSDMGKALLSDVIGYVELDSSMLSDEIDKIGGNQLYWNSGSDCNGESVTANVTTTSSAGKDSDNDKNYGKRIRSLRAAVISLVIVIFILIIVGFAYFFIQIQRLRHKSNRGIELQKLHDDESAMPTTGQHETINLIPDDE